MIIFNYKLVNVLIEDGFKMLRVERSTSNQSRIVFVFEDDDRLLGKIEEFKNNNNYNKIK
ncbi:MAG: DUF5659 domain-containing protein [Clostridium sp.]|uniref:DUF5659 domain-containing protein n=1 Tax=Clostridium sp. TaxID=1506 RepID=UPI003EE68986